MLQLSLLTSLLLYSLSSFAEEAKTISSIQNIVSESNEDFSLVNIFFSTPLDSPHPSVETYDGFIQVTLKNTITAEPGKFFEGSGSFVKKVSSFQVSPTDSLVRIFSSPIKKDIKDAIETSVAQNKLSIVMKNSIFHTDAPGPIAANADSPQAKVEPFDINTYLRRAGLFSLLFFLLVLGFFTLRRFRRNQSLNKLTEPLVEMKTLNQLHLSPKQKLTLVQVGKEQILLAISPENVSFISFVQKHNPIVYAPAPPLQQIRREDPTLGLKRPQPEQFLKGLKESMEKHQKKEIPKVEQETPQEKKKIHYAIDDEGITDRTKESTTAIDDITKLIREKLKALPKG
ncbi:MAG: flagellar biosynthetic protein FliO [Deltaproteobacteria bacterium]|nr:flagellar biosynthetic protein FliO [Deltaproteobacteria bacterium]